MSDFVLSNRFKLELRWSKILQSKAGEIHIVDAYFTGPALKQADKINNNDYIQIDFCSQYIVTVRGVFVAKFSWGEVNYSQDNKVYLKNALITYDPMIEGLPKIDHTDYLVINTRNHENEKHLYNMFYDVYIIGKDNGFRDYRR